MVITNWLRICAKFFASSSKSLSVSPHRTGSMPCSSSFLNTSSEFSEVIIITSENSDEVFKKLEEQGIDPVLWGLTDKDFELLAKNFAQIRNQLVITNNLLDKYKEYYEPKTDEK